MLAGPLLLFFKSRRFLDSFGRLDVISDDDGGKRSMNDRVDQCDEKRRSKRTADFIETVKLISALLRL